KPRLLAEFRRRGLWLVDAAKCAVNGLATGARRDAAVARCAEHWLWRELRLLDPAHLVLLKANVREVLEAPLVRWGYGPRLLGNHAIPHPACGQIGNFRHAMRLVIGRYP